MTDAVAAASTFLDAQRVPRFRTAPHNVDVLATPTDFQHALLAAIANAAHRIVLASLYIGPNDTELANALATRLAAIPSLRVTILLDFFRGTRGCVRTGDNAAETAQDSVELIAQLATRFPGRVSLSLYRTPALANDWIRDRITPRLCEVIGLQHMKIYVVDNTTIVSGANLSADYYTNRQDRYVLFRDHHGLADYYHDLVATVSRFSFPVCFDRDVAAREIRANGRSAPVQLVESPTASQHVFPVLTDDVLKLRSPETQALFKYARDGRIFLDPPIVSSQVVETRFGTTAFRSLARRSLERFIEKWHVWTTSRRHFGAMDAPTSTKTFGGGGGAGVGVGVAGATNNNLPNATTISASIDGGFKAIAPAPDYYAARHHGTVLLFPLVQMGEFGLRQEEDVLHGLIAKLTRLANKDALLPPSVTPAGSLADRRLSGDINTVSEQQLNLSRYRLIICSGYLNFTDTFIKSIMDFTYEYKLMFARILHGSNGSNDQPVALGKNRNLDTLIVTSAPEANGFFNSKGISKYLPAAYTHLEYRLLNAEKAYLDRTIVNRKLEKMAKDGVSDFQSLKERAANVLDFNDVDSSKAGRLFSLLEYCKPQWTWHAKGVWLIGSSDVVLPTNNSPQIGRSDSGQPNATNSFLTIVGSSNYGYRSQRRDLENQLVMLAQHEPELTKRVAHNAYNVLLNTQDNRRMNLAKLTADPSRRVPFFVAMATRLVRKFL